MRVFLVVMAWVLGILAVLALVGFVLWSMYGREYLSAFKTASEEGARIGSTTSDAVCYEKIAERMEGCEGIQCTLEAKFFASSCFRKVRVRTDMCEGVPRILDLLEYVAWQDEVCSKIAPDNDGCEKVVQEVAKYCEARNG